MKLLLTIFLLFLFSFCVVAQDQYDAEKCKDFIQQNKIVKCWDWIVPLKTTKAEIEKAFSESVSENKDHYKQTYKTEFGKISVGYTTKDDQFVGSCACRLKAGVAVTIFIPLDLSVKVSELGLDLTKLEKTLLWHDGSFLTYDSEDLGIEINVFNNGRDEKVDYVKYNPVNKNKLVSSYQIKYSDFWKYIKPLKTTRQEIERRFGQPKEKDCTSCIYYSIDEKIQVDYSTIPCKGSLEGWNVPPDTVLKFTISPSQKIKFSNLNVNEKDYFSYFYFDDLGHSGQENVRLNKINGTLYNLSMFDEIENVSLQPSEDDSKLRCQCYPPYYLFSSFYKPEPESDFFPNTFTQDNIKPELDGLFLHLGLKGKPYTAYFIVYSGKNEDKKKYNTFVEKVEKHWKYRNYPPEAVKIMDGGRREEFKIDYYILPRDNPPPVPNPDKPSEDCLEKAIK